MEDLDKVLSTLAAHAEAAAADETEDGKRKAMERIESITADMHQRRDELHSMEMLQTKTRSQVRIVSTLRGSSLHMLT